MRLAVRRVVGALVFGPACLVSVLAGQANAKQPTATATARSCLAEIGPRRADAMRRECRVVAPASACRPEASCETWAREIARACEAAGADAPPLCDAHGGIDDDDDEDDGG